MKISRRHLIVFLHLLLILSAQAQTPPPDAGKSAPPPAANAAAAKKPVNDNFTVVEAKAALSTHAEEKQQLENERQAALAQAAKAKPDERAKLIAAFLAATEVRRKKIQDETPRMSDLSAKVFRAERGNPPASPPQAPRK